MSASIWLNLHFVAVVLLFIALLSRGLSLFTQDSQAFERFRTLFVALQHGALTLVVLTGVVLLWLAHFQISTWFYAKIILFFVMLSSLMKAYKKDPQILLVQRRAGWIIAMAAFFAIYALVILRPTFN